MLGYNSYRRDELEDMLGKERENVKALEKKIKEKDRNIRGLKRALWLARAVRAKEHLWHDVKPDGLPKEDYDGHDWVLVQLREKCGIELIPRVAEYRRHLKRWVFIDEDYDTENSHEFRYLRDKCEVIGWRDIDFAYYGKKFFVQQEINKNVECKCLKKAEVYR